MFVALGLFVVLWWTWIGFAVLYNRHGDDDRTEHLLFLVGSVPIGVAAVALEPAAHGDVAVFAGAMAVVRLVLAVSHGEGTTDFRARITRAYGLSALLFAVSIVVPEPFTYFVWLAAVGNESRALLRNDKTHPGQTLDPHHFAERFALLMIILLGEVLIEAAQAPVEDTAGWIALVGGDGAGRRAVVAVLRLGRRAQPAGARALRRLPDDGAGDLRRGPHAPGLLAVGHRRRRRADAGRGPAAVRVLARRHRCRGLSAGHAGVRACRPPARTRSDRARPGDRRHLQPRPAARGPLPARVPVLFDCVGHRLRSALDRCSTPGPPYG